MKYQCNASPCGLYNMVTFGIKFEKRYLSEKESAGKNFNFISFGFSKFMLLIVMFVRNSTELPFWECAVTIAKFH